MRGGSECDSKGRFWCPPLTFVQMSAWARWPKSVQNDFCKRVLRPLEGLKQVVLCCFELFSTHISLCRFPKTCKRGKWPKLALKVMTYKYHVPLPCLIVMHCLGHPQDDNEWCPHVMGLVGSICASKIDPRQFCPILFLGHLGCSNGPFQAVFNQYHPMQLAKSLESDLI